LGRKGVKLQNVRKRVKKFQSSACDAAALILRDQNGQALPYIYFSRMSRGADPPPSCSPRMRPGGLLWREPEAISLSSDEPGDYRSRQKIFGQSQTRFDAAISRRGLSDLDST
jgi:hypothetical protein